MISVIIVAYNEELMIDHIIHQLSLQKTNQEIETILADGGSTDATVKNAKKLGIKVVQSAPGKAIQMNAAAKQASGDILWFVHTDMTFLPNTIKTIETEIESGIDGGGFSNRFDEYNDKIKQLGRLMNFRFLSSKEQSDRGIFYGDNGIFVKREVFNTLGGFKEIPIMEDYDFSMRLRDNYTVKKIYDPEIIVSARRHIKAGFIKTRFQWVMIKQLYKLGVSPHTLAAWYKNIR